MNNSEFDREVNRLVNLVQNKGKSVEELEPIARVNLAVREFKRNPLFDDPEEQKNAEEQYRKYLETNEIESTSDLYTLRSLIYNEVLEQRIQKELNTQASKNKIPYDKTLKSLTDLQNQMLSLKIKLGIDRKDNEKDELSALQLQQKRVDHYINNHKDEFSFGVGWTCDKCGYKDFETFLLYKRVKDFDGKIKHPFYSGKYLFSLPLIKLVKEKILTKEQASSILLGAGMSKEWQASNEDKKWCEDYIVWCIENFTELKDLCTRK